MYWLVPEQYLCLNSAFINPSSSNYCMLHAVLIYLNNLPHWWLIVSSLYNQLVEYYMRPLIVVQPSHFSRMAWAETSKCFESPTLRKYNSCELRASFWFHSNVSSTKTSTNLCSVHDHHSLHRSGLRQISSHIWLPTIAMKRCPLRLT